MKVYKLKAEKRGDVGKAASKRLRKEGKVPCVMYGGEKNISFSALHKDFINMVYTPDIFLVDIDIDGSVHRGVVQEMQFHPVTDKILHVDFVEVYEDRPFTVSLPIEFVGSSVGIKAGGKMRVNKRYLKVNGLAKDMPEKLKVDISKVGIGDTVNVSELSYDNLTLLDHPKAMVMGIVSSRVAAKGMILQEEEPEAEAEGEAADEVADSQSKEGSSES